jgi:phosphate transport system substrate-binding protein
MHAFEFMVKRTFLTTLFWLALLVSNSFKVAHADTLRLGGSGSTTALAKLLVSAYNQKHPQDMITVTPALGTSGGIKALHAKAVGVALMSRPLTDSERGLQAVEFARTPFVLAVAASNPKNDMDFAELAKIYAAANPTWPDGTRMRLVLRPTEDNDSKIISRFSAEVAASWLAAHDRDGAFISATDEDTIAAIQRLPGALGFTTLGQILADKRPLKALSLQGKTPSVHSIKDGSYPYYKRHFLVTDSQSTPIIERFLAFAATVEAQTLLAAHGCWVGDFKTP